MKTYHEIFRNTVTLENLFEAWHEFHKGKKEKKDVVIFERFLEDNLFALYEDLANEKYEHGPYKRFVIRDPKLRIIHKATVRDRVVHHLIHRALLPCFEPAFIFDSYSCRDNKGAHRGVRRLAQFCRRVFLTYKTCFVLKCDIKKFFNSIDHKILLEVIRRRIQDEKMLSLIKKIIESFSQPCVIRERERERESKGCPIGNLTSQFFANIYLNELDYFVKHTLKIKNYIRYTDDFVIVHHDYQYLKELKEKIASFLSEKLKLELHPQKVSIRKYRQGIDFLGYVVLPRAIVLRTKTKRRIMKKIFALARATKDGISPESHFIQSLHSYLSVLSYAKSYKLKNILLHELWSIFRKP